MTTNEVTYPEGAVKVLDKGFVRLVDVMGDDSSIVQAARVSYGKGTKKVTEDEALIRYLMRQKHSTPFEMVEFKFHCRMPIFVARQWIRHRTANVNEVSGRYSEMPDLFYVPDKSVCTTQSSSNKQGGSNDQVHRPDDVVYSFVYSQKLLYEEYQGHLRKGLRKELSRINLPLSLYTEWYWKIDLHNLFHFLRLRLDSHAQYEIRVYAEAMAEMVKGKVPLAWKAFEDYVLNAMVLSAQEVEILRLILAGVNPAVSRILPNEREKAEWLTKEAKLRMSEV